MTAQTDFARSWRALGRLGDLDLPLEGSSRAEAVTAVLAACRVDGRGHEDDRSHEDRHDNEDRHGDQARVREAWALTLSGRIGGLAAVLARSGGVIRPQLECAEPSCREAFEVELPVELLVTLAALAERERALGTPALDALGVRLRRPTGDDQRRWGAHRYGSAAEAERALLASLRVPADDQLGAGTVEGPSMAASVRKEPASNQRPGEGEPLLGDLAALSDEQLAAISMAMEEADPLPAFRVASVCPACSQEGEHAIDLEALLLRLLARRQRALLRDIHRLARAYGWSEPQVLAIPERRRRAYLRLITGEDA